jgi:uncharacterized membrane protein YdbT with pleckstrin-like domain
MGFGSALNHPQQIGNAKLTVVVVVVVVVVVLVVVVVVVYQIVSICIRMDGKYQSRAETRRMPRGDSTGDHLSCPS